jgi:hypothetical protein
VSNVFRWAVTAVALVSIVIPVFGAKSSLGWRTFSKNENTWLYYPKGLMLFSTLSRTVKPVTIDAARPVDTLTDCIEYDGYLWVASSAGIYQVDLASQSGERIAMPGDVVKTGKIAQDFDYLWFGTGDTLFRFDKLGQEWLTFTLPEKIDTLLGIWSNGDEVFCLGTSILLRFTTSTEKWNRYSHEKPFGSKAIFYPGSETFKVLDGADIIRYEPSSFSWEKTSLGGVPRDLVDLGDELYCTDGNMVKQVNTATGMVRPLNIPKVENIESIVVTGDSLTMVMPSRVASYSLSKETMSFTEYEKSFGIESIQDILPLQTYLVIFTEGTIVIYEKATKAWQYISRSAMKQKVKAFNWNEEECIVRYGKGFQSSMSGNVEMGMSLQSDGYDYDTSITRNFSTGAWDTTFDSTSLLKFSQPSFYGNMTMHSTDKNDRVADIFFDNTSFINAPKKGLYYRGNRDDYLNTLRVGTTNNEQMASTVLPEVDMEGGSIVLESRKRLEKRDRKIARVAGGAGYITSRTVIRKLPYRADGTYYLFKEDGEDTTARKTTTIIPGSMKVMVDGALLDTTYYTLYTSTGKLEFNTSSPVDPVSSLTVEYKVQPLPDGDISKVEFVPSHHFGQLYYGTATVSPTEWISAKVGYTGIDRDSLHNILTAATPIEIRSDKMKLMLKATPEFAYNVNSGAKAGGATLQSRFGSSTGLQFNGRFADSNFVSTDTLTRGIGALRQEYDATLYHDIRQELPLSYYQHQRFSDRGSENRFEFNAGSHFVNFPFLDLKLSRTVFEKDVDFETDTAVFDSIFQKKDKMYIRLYETSSPFLEKLTRFEKIAYELGHSEYRSRNRGSTDWNQGRVTTLKFTLMPIQRIIMLGEVLYRGDMKIKDSPSTDVIPRFSLQLVDVPKGVDVAGFYNINFKRFSRDDRCTDTISRIINVVLKPGQWFEPLGWFSPRGQISQNIQTRLNSIGVSPWDIFSGNYGYRNNEIVKEIGVNIFPVDGMLLTNTNKWTEGTSFEGYKFQTINRLQMVFNARNIITGSYTFTDDQEVANHNALMMYEKAWSSWLRTTPAALLSSRTDSTGNTFSAGPKFTINMNIKDFSFIRMLTNVHEVQCTWNKLDGEVESTPDISYLFNLRLQIKPNIEIANIEQVVMKAGKYDTFLSKLNVFIYF